MRLRGVLLDIDGTLLDSNDAHARAWVEVLKTAGFEVSFEQLHSRIGMGGEKIVAELAGLPPDSAESKQIRDARSKLFRDRYLENLHATRGARELLERFRQDSLRLVVATSAEDEELHALLKQAGVDDLIDTSATSSDAGRSKPDPDVIAAALKRGHLSPNRCFLLGDTPYDVAAAAQANVVTVAVLSGGFSKTSLSDAVAIYRDPADILADYSLVMRQVEAALEAR